MRMEIRFSHMDRSESLEDYAREKVLAVVEEVLHRHDGHVMIWLNADTNRTARTTPNFVCEIEVRYPPRKDIFVSKSNQDMHAAINEAVETLHVLLRDEGKREVQQMRNSGSNS